jgi:hypothetical protein
LIDLYPRITSQLKSEFKNTIETSPAQEAFKGMETRVLQIEILDLGARDARVLVTAQRIETDANRTQNVFFQALDLGMVKQGEFWYVDSALWQ